MRSRIPEIATRVLDEPLALRIHDKTTGDTNANCPNDRDRRVMGTQVEDRLGAKFVPANEGKSELSTNSGRPTYVPERRSPLSFARACSFTRLNSGHHLVRILSVFFHTLKQMLNAATQGWCPRLLETGHGSRCESQHDAASDDTHAVEDGWCFQRDL